MDVSSGRTQQTFSAPDWITVLTGRWAREHGILDNDSAGPIKVETLFERVEEDVPGSRSLLVTQWKRLYELVRERLDARSGLHHATVLRADDAAIEQEVLGTWRRCQPQLAFIHLDAVDQAGHRGAFDVGDAGYAAAVRETDGRLRRLWESALNVSPGPERLVIVVSDHGGMGNGHGRYSEAERMAPVLVVMPAGHSAVGVRDLVGVGRVVLEFLRGG
ncbi:alkaline phosphatase family protein [Pseudomonas putida]|uniref:Type I phosphodiesterase/nucleotide pyrophosphatase n=1 Tax=Pseudomonas putida TaxID=303 RepID=A0A1Q9RAI7_PSEPU|nr:alkaline phosphatase family protein [Pseudomonas putida]OLS64387.1 hypothetical protein PSEMO_06720 [Pseudomonas putida]